MCDASRQPRRPATSKLCRMLLPIGLILAGCRSLQPRPKVIAVEGEQVPHKISKGGTSDYDGWVVPTPLFNRLTPCFRDTLQNPPPADPDSNPFPVTEANP